MEAKVFKREEELNRFMGIGVQFTVSGERLNGRYNEGSGIKILDCLKGGIKIKNRNPKKY